MDASRFDQISKLFAARTLSRRQALAASAGLAAASLGHAGAQDTATPEAVPAEPYTGEKTMYLFVQTFHGGSITPTEGQEGRYTVALEPGTGRTIYFGDRPSRDVGVTDTADFLEGLGFPEDNPPNAALIVETEPGETDIAVVELFNPTYDPTSQGVTYDVEVLENWQEDLELGLREEPTDLAALAPSFGSAQLFIDDCANQVISCRDANGTLRGWLGSQLHCYWLSLGRCLPCEPVGALTVRQITDYWSDRCNETFPECNGNCEPRSG